MVFTFPSLTLAHTVDPLVGAQRRLSPRFADCHSSRRLSTPEFSTAALHFGVITAVVAPLVRLWLAAVAHRRQRDVPDDPPPAAL